MWNCPEMEMYGIVQILYGKASFQNFIKPSVNPGEK